MRARIVAATLKVAEFLVDFKPPVDGLGFESSGFRHPLGRTAYRSPAPSGVARRSRSSRAAMSCRNPFQKLAKGDLVVGNCGDLQGQSCVSQPNPTEQHHSDHRCGDTTPSTPGWWLSAAFRRASWESPLGPKVRVVGYIAGHTRRKNKRITIYARCSTDEQTTENQIQQSRFLPGVVVAPSNYHCFSSIHVSITHCVLTQAQ
jgi:hypothetical protein